MRKGARTEEPPVRVKDLGRAPGGLDPVHHMPDPLKARQLPEFFRSVTWAANHPQEPPRWVIAPQGLVTLLSDNDPAVIGESNAHDIMQEVGLLAL